MNQKLGPKNRLSRSGRAVQDADYLRRGSARVRSRNRTYRNTSPAGLLQGEARKLTQQRSASGQGEAFFAEGGDCRQSFEDSARRPNPANNLLRVMLQWRWFLTFGA